MPKQGDYKPQSKASQTNSRSSDAAGAYSDRTNPYGKAKKGETAAQAKTRRAKFYTKQRTDAEEMGNQARVNKIASKQGKKGQNVDADFVNKAILAAVPMIAGVLRGGMAARPGMRPGAAPGGQMPQGPNPLMPRPQGGPPANPQMPIARPVAQPMQQPMQRGLPGQVPRLPQAPQQGQMPGGQQPQLPPQVMQALRQRALPAQQQRALPPGRPQMPARPAMRQIEAKPSVRKSTTRPKPKSQVSAKGSQRSKAPSGSTRTAGLKKTTPKKTSAKKTPKKSGK